MVIYLAFPLGIDPAASQATARTGAIPDYYQLLTLWTNVLFVIYTILAFVALACYGGAVLSTHVLPRWVGWVLLVYSLAGLGLTGVTQGNVPPFLQHLLADLGGRAAPSASAEITCRPDGASRSAEIRYHTVCSP